MLEILNTTKSYNTAEDCFFKHEQWTNTFTGIKISLGVITKLIFQNILPLLMPLSENSPFSILVLLKKNIFTFFQVSFGFQWLKEQEK